MTFIDAQPQAGTQKSPQQTKISQPCYTDTDHVHFPDGRLTTLPPYAVASALSDYVTLLGGARFIHGQKRTGTNAGTWFVIGTNTRLYAVKNSNLFNITPFADQKAESLGNDPIAVHSGDATVTITWAAHGLSVGDAITLSGATTVDGFTPNDLNIEHTITTVPTADTFTIEMGATASSSTTGGGASVTAASIGVAATLGTNPISTTSGDATVTVTYTAHGLAVGDRIKLRDATATGGITAAQLNVEHIVATVPTANTFTIEVVAASSTATGGGSAVRIYKQIAAGNLGQDAAVGFGAGLYGEGLYGVGGESQGAQTYPRIWSGAQFGNDMVLCAGDYLSGDGQKIYFWDCDSSKAPTVLANAPTNCNWVTVVNNAVVALCGTQVKVCQIGDATVWSGLTTFTSRELSIWKLISGTAYTEKDGIIYAPNRVFLLSYTGDEYLWDLREIFNEDGIIAPNAFVILDTKIYWRGFRGSYVFDGAPPRLVENNQNDDWIIQNTNYAQVWKSFAFADPQSGEWYFHFPTGTSSEPSDYVIYNPRNGSHTLGKMNRTAAQQVPMIDQVFYMINGASESTAGTLYRHFTNGAVTFSWYAETSFSYVAKGEKRGFLRKIFPDSSQNGSCTLNILTREYPQGATTTSGNYTFGQTTKYISTKASGKLVALKFSGNVAYTMGGWLMDIITRGAR